MEKEEDFMQVLQFKAHTRGFANLGWLHSFHTFSFARYFNPNRMGFGVLRVINDDTIAPHSGFGTHAHRDMEIISIPLSGELRHKDSMGNTHIIKKGEVQIMSAGSGIQHSEFNNLQHESTNFLQIWILPEERDIAPRYFQKEFPFENNWNQWLSIISPKGENGSLPINQQAYFSRGLFEAGEEVVYELKKRNHGLFIMNLSGNFEVDKCGEVLEAKDALGVWDIDKVRLRFKEESDVLAIEVPMF